MPKINSSDGVSVRAVAGRAISYKEALAIFGSAASAGMDLLGY
jgi:hypothetical protein